MLYFINIQLANIAHQVLLNTVESKAAFSHLLNCLGLVPALYNNTVDCTQHPSAVDPMPAVHKDRRLVTVRDDLQETNDILSTRTSGCHVNMLVIQSGAFNPVAV
jgi:hypothetical protein